MKLSLALTTYNRYDMLLDSFQEVLQDPRIDEIVIVDDCSTDDTYLRLVDYAAVHSKIKVFANPENLGMSRNKAQAVKHCSNEWVLLFDSDNKLDKSYLNAFWEQVRSPDELVKNVIYCPEFAKPQFDYRKFSGEYLDYDTIKKHLNDPMFACHLNTSNYIVPKSEYLKVYQHNPEVKETDTVWFAYLWLKAGNKFFITNNMVYDHRVHSGSGWLENAAYNTKKGNEILKLIKEL